MSVSDSLLSSHRFHHFLGPLSLQVHDQMVEIFDHPDVVMTTFVQAVIDRVLLVGA